MDVVVGSERRPDLGLVDPPCRAKQLPPDHTPAREIQMVFIGDPVQPADRILRYPDDAQIHAWDKTTGGKVTLSGSKLSTLSPPPSGGDRNSPDAGCGWGVSIVI